MNTRIFQRAVVPAMICSALGLSAAGPVRAEYRCDHPQGPVDRRACDYAQQGQAALHHFIERTRAIYGLYFYDYVRPESTAGAQSDATDRAAAVSEEGPARHVEVSAIPQA
ncbi:MAG TPA: hypothetical protein VMG60_15745 [Burkholderiaceae bacterium]|nr:hypothetical protein [Burkholderiaceae bacterium]